MAKLNWNRPNGGYESEPWRKNCKIKKSTKKKKVKRQTLDQAINVETVFLSGKFKGHNISSLYKRNPNYFIWVLENMPKGIVAQQIILYFTKYPHKI